jgi:hypothetical protein
MLPDAYVRKRAVDIRISDLNETTSNERWENILATNSLMCVLIPPRGGFRKECAFFLDFMEIELDKMSIADDNIITSLMGEPSGPRARKHVRAFLLRTPD